MLGHGQVSNSYRFLMDEAVSNCYPEFDLFIHKAFAAPLGLRSRHRPRRL